MTGIEPTFFVLDAPGPQFDEMAAIYRQAIVASEQKSTAELRAMLENPSYRILVASMAGRIAGFAIGYFFAGRDFWLLEYTAVHRDMRSHGLGSSLFLEAKRLADKIAPDAACLLEVDQPRGLASTAGDEWKRLKFYHRAGCRKVQGVDYILPLEVAGTPPPMWLLVHGLDDRAEVAKSDVVDWLMSIYTEVYDQRVDDPRLRTMFSAKRMDRLKLEPLV